MGLVRFGVRGFSFCGALEIVAWSYDGILLDFFKYVLSVSTRADEP